MSSLFHPLCGSNLSTLLRLFLTNGGIDRPNLAPATLAMAVTLARLPFSTLERILMTGFYERRVQVKAPIFIVGYWRSGTTHLHNLLGQSEHFGYISPLAVGLPWDILGIVRLFQPLLELALPSDRHVDNVAVTPDSPQEDSIALASMIPLSYYHGLYFPQRFQYHFERGVFFSRLQRERNRHLAALAYSSIKKSFHPSKRQTITNQKPRLCGTHCQIASYLARC